MLILHNLLDIPKEAGLFPAIGLTIGNFDGVHLGHQELLKKIKVECKQLGLIFVVVTFVPHPQKILHPDKENFLISSYTERRKLLEALGVEVLVEINFTRDFSTLLPEDFLVNHLLAYPNLKNFYLGYDFAFGANKTGKHDLVNSVCRQRGIKVEIQPRFDFHGSAVSSTLIREKLFQGLMGEVNDILSRPFHLEGVVIKGEGRGKKIGFPTANIQAANDLLIPQKGVYVTRTLYGNMIFQSVTNIGFNPTFKDTNQIHVETNLFDFNSDIYGENLEIQFLMKIRDEIKFPTVNDLITQIKTDVQKARFFLDKK
jgi:riboflavin kinase/FMN adenylyltransferase